jgi:NifU-like protein
MPIPRELLEHFRSPRNKRPMPDATVKGEVEAGRENQRFTLYLRLSPDKARVEDASFENDGDRQADASLSALTLVLKGKATSELDQVDVNDVAKVLGLLDAPGAVIPAIEALKAALAALRGEANPYEAEGRLVCHCFHVREGRIRRTIQERELRSVEDVTRWTRACGGCRSCRSDIHLILEQERDRS